MCKFFEKNPDYRTAQGKAMIFHFKETGPYGKTFFQVIIGKIIVLKMIKVLKGF